MRLTVRALRVKRDRTTVAGACSVYTGKGTCTYGTGQTRRATVTVAVEAKTVQSYDVVVIKSSFSSFSSHR